MRKNNLYLIGFMGTGKSTIGRIIARNRSEMIFCEMDDMIEKHEGKTISDIFAELGEAYFRQVETDVLKEIADMDNAIVSCGGGVPLKDENIEIMKQSGTIIWLTASPDTIYNRVCCNNKRPLLKGNMTIEHITEMMNNRHSQYEKAADQQVSTEAGRPELTAENVVRIMQL